jgi:hypothetical protein
MPSYERRHSLVFKFKQQESKPVRKFSKQNSLIRIWTETGRIRSWIVKIDSKFLIVVNVAYVNIVKAHANGKLEFD